MGAAMALHISDVDAGFAAADAPVTELRSFKEERSRHPEPEYEEAQTGIPPTFEEFAAWYGVERRIRDILSRMGGGGSTVFGRRTPCGVRPQSVLQMLLLAVAGQCACLTQRDFHDECSIIR